MIIIGYGANLDSEYGPPEKTFEIVCRMLEATNVEIFKTSSLWRTSPVGAAEDQPWYINAIIAVKSNMDAACLLSSLLDIEAELGRERTYKNAPRKVDLDLIDYKGVKQNYPNLTLPHPRMKERGFVLLPLQEVTPDWKHPVSKEGLAELIEKLPEDQEYQRLDNA